MKDELFPLVDAHGNIIGSVQRGEAHGNPQLIHPVVHCVVTHERGDLLLQMRSHNKDIQPGKWDTSMGGHVGYGETVAEALRREFAEELGLDIEPYQPRFLYRYLNRSDVETELVYTYRCTANGPFRPQASEIDELRFWSHADITAALGTGILTPNFEYEFSQLTRRSSAAVTG